MGIASLLGGIGRSVDKLHPLSDKPSDYESKSALSNTADIGLNAIGSWMTSTASITVLYFATIRWYKADELSIIYR